MFLRDLLLPDTGEELVVLTDKFNAYFQKLYPFTTENISGYIDYFHLEGKSLLTVGSSGDQAINAILKGCTDITVADINPYTRYYYYLKVAALISLEMDEYLEFLRYMNYINEKKKNKRVLNIETYEKIKQNLKKLDVESFLFWNKLFYTKSSTSIRRKYFNKDEYTTSLIKKCNPYLQSDELYKETQAKISSVKPTFLTMNLIIEQPDRYYDNIWLSNIGAYVDLHTLKLFVQKINELLNKKGKLLISYLYSFDKNTEYGHGWDPIYDLDRTLPLLKQYDPILHSFSGVEDTDSILLSKKI